MPKVRSISRSEHHFYYTMSGMPFANVKFRRAKIIETINQTALKVEHELKRLHNRIYAYAESIYPNPDPSPAYVITPMSLIFDAIRLHYLYDYYLHLIGDIPLEQAKIDEFKAILLRLQTATANYNGTFEEGQEYPVMTYFLNCYYVLGLIPDYKNLHSMGKVTRYERGACSYGTIQI